MKAVKKKKNMGMFNSARKRRIKTKMFSEQAEKCFWCQRAMQMTDASFDHLVPRSRGGGNALANLVLAHKACNTARGDQIWPYGKTPIQKAAAES